MMEMVEKEEKERSVDSVDTLFSLKMMIGSDLMIPVQISIDSSKFLELRLMTMFPCCRLCTFFDYISFPNLH